MDRRAHLPSLDRTPLAHLSEGGAHAIVGYQLAQATLVTDQLYAEHVGRPLGLRRVEFTILALVQGNPGVTARQLARVLAVTPPNIATWLAGLESRGLISRERSGADARMQHLQLTPRGGELADRAAAALVEGEHAALAVLSGAERAMLLELLHKVALTRRRLDREG